MSVMTSSCTTDEDTITVPQDGILSDNEKKKSLLGTEALSISFETKQQQPPPSSMKDKRSLDPSREREGSQPEIVCATGRCESQAEQQVIGEDRSTTTGKRCACGQNDATLHVEASSLALAPTLETLADNSFLAEEEAIIISCSDDKTDPNQNDPMTDSSSGNSSDRQTHLESSKEKVKATSVWADINQDATIVSSLVKELHAETSLDASGGTLSRRLYGLHCSAQRSLKETGEELSQLGSCIDHGPGIQLTFHEAVRAGDEERVAALLASGLVQDLNEPDWNVSGDPPLLVAASNHSLPVLSVLLANGCEPGVRSPRGESALHRAILNGASAETVLELVQELLKYGCPASVKEAGGGLTALHVLTRQLANAQASKNLGRNFDAALRALELLAKAGPVNAKDHQGRSALHILASSTACADASQTKEMESMLESFLAAGADPSLKNDRGETPLHESLECGALSTAFLLIPHTPAGLTSRYGESPLHIASRKNYVDVVGKLLERGEDPSVQDAGGNTPLHLASARGFHQTVSLLVISPLAHLEKLNSDGLTALQVAAESGFVTTVKLLLKAGADPSQTVHYSATTLHRHPDISVLIDHELTRRRQLAA